MEKACDVAIVGGGPAGLSTALMLGRARRSVIVFDDGRERNLSVRESHGFLGHDGMSPTELLARARTQLDPYPTVERMDDHVDVVEGAIERFRLQLRCGDTVTARRVIFATGMFDDLPEIDGIETLWGKRVFVCPFCDGWEFHDKRIAVIGNTRSAVEFAQELWNWSRDLVVCSTKRTPLTAELQTWQSVAGLEIIESQPAIVREQQGKVIVDCDGGGQVECDVIFICAPLKQHSKLPEVLGCELTERGTIKIDIDGRTTVPGSYAVGDCVTHYHQIAFAAASGARAAIAINEELYMSDAQVLVDSARPVSEVVTE